MYIKIIYTINIYLYTLIKNKIFSIIKRYKNKIKNGYKL